MRTLHVTFDTDEGPQEMPPEALAQSYEEFLLAHYYAEPNSIEAKVKARNMRNHFYRFMTEDIRVKSEMPHPNEFVYMNKPDLIQLHNDLTKFETLIVKRCAEKRERDPDTLEAISELQGLIEILVNEYE